MWTILNIVLVVEKKLITNKIVVLRGDNMRDTFSIIKMDLDKLNRKIDEYVNITNKSNPYIFMSENTAKSVDFTISPLNLFLRITSKYKDEHEPNGRIAEYTGHKIFINNDLEYGEIEIR